MIRMQNAVLLRSAELLCGMTHHVPHTRLIDYNQANPVRKQDPVSPAHAFIQKAMWPRNFMMVMFLYQNPGTTKRGICDHLQWPLWKVQITIYIK